MSHLSSSPYRPAWIWAAIYQSHQQKPAGRCAACYLTWLSGSSSAHILYTDPQPCYDPLFRCIWHYTGAVRGDSCSGGKICGRRVLTEISGLLLFLESDRLDICLGFCHLKSILFVMNCNNVRFGLYSQQHHLLYCFFFMRTFYSRYCNNADLILVSDCRQCQIEKLWLWLRLLVCN